MKYTKRNYYGFDHAAVNKKFEGGLTYINDFQLKGQQGGDLTAAVYKCSNPNKAKGHKEYVLLYFSHGTLYVSGRTKKEIFKERMATGAYCTGCKTVLVSLARRDFVKCTCGSFVDGGQKDYGRYGANDLSTLVSVKVNLLTNRVYKVK